MPFYGCTTSRTGCPVAVGRLSCVRALGGHPWGVRQANSTRVYDAVTHACGLVIHGRPPRYLDYSWVMHACGFVSSPCLLQQL